VAYELLISITDANESQEEKNMSLVTMKIDGHEVKAEGREPILKPITSPPVRVSRFERTPRMYFNTAG
jgi:hypothetical protein